MVYPILKLSKGQFDLDIIDTKSLDGAVLSMGSDDSVETFATFLTLAQAFIGQYEDGYDKGWADAESMLQEEQDFDC